MTTSQLAFLKEFFSGNFHEDCFEDDVTRDAIITGYARSITQGAGQSIAQDIRAFANQFSTDSELEENLYTQLGCSYCPSGEGKSAKAWLETVADQISNPDLNMRLREFPELPGWTFAATEISGGVYKAVGNDQSGRNVECTGLDPDALIEKCKQAALKICSATRESER
jgi:hypothetical protein